MPRTVLFVDDSAVARAVGARRLREAGVDVTTLASSAEASGVDGSTFSAALLDLELGDGFGTDIARSLRARDPALPIAFLTASDELHRLDEAAALGPVFSKASGVDEAVRWVLAAIA